jgi:predicted nuclease of predicted toxin-antitoxin system
MKFKLDENLPVDLVDDLTRLGHDTDTVEGEDLKGANDATVLLSARKSNRILMTLDKGAASILEHPASEHGAVVLFRPAERGRGAVLEFVRTRLQNLLKLDLENRLVVVTTSRIPIR